MLRVGEIVLMDKLKQQLSGGNRRHNIAKLVQNYARGLLIQKAILFALLRCKLFTELRASNLSIILETILSDKHIPPSLRSRARKLWSQKTVT